MGVDWLLSCAISFDGVWYDKSQGGKVKMRNALDVEYVHMQEKQQNVKI